MELSRLSLLEARLLEQVTQSFGPSTAKILPNVALEQGGNQRLLI
jgi:hypothetical protein